MKFYGLEWGNWKQVEKAQVKYKITILEDVCEPFIWKYEFERRMQTYGQKLKRA